MDEKFWPCWPKPLYASVISEIPCSLYKNVSRKSASCTAMEILWNKRAATRFGHISDSILMLTFFSLTEIRCSAAAAVNGASRCWQNNSHSTHPFTLLSHDIPFIVAAMFLPTFGQALLTLPFYTPTHTCTHEPWRWKQKSSSITCITASCSDQLTTTKCPRKSIFFLSEIWVLYLHLTSFL